MSTMTPEWLADDIRNFVRTYLDGGFEDLDRKAFDATLKGKLEALRRTALDTGEHQGICLERDTVSAPRLKERDAMISELENTLKLLRDNLAKLRGEIDALKMELKDAQAAASIRAKEHRDVQAHNDALEFKARALGYAVCFLEDQIEQRDDRLQELVVQVNAK